MTTTNDSTAQWATDLAAAVAQVEPNTVVPPDVLVAIAMSFEQVTHLNSDQYLLTPFGYPAVPRPRAPEADGTGRVPANVALAYAGNPVFWLDWQTAAKSEDESEWEWAVRLWMECVLRGWWDPEDGEWYDVLPEHGIDPGGPEVAAYVSGQPGTRLSALVIDPDTDVDPGEARRAAKEIVAELTKVLSELEGEALSDVHAEVESARALLADPSGDQQALTNLMRSLQAIQGAAKAGHDITPGVVGAWAALDAALAVADAVFEATAFAAIPLLLAGSSSEGEYLSAVETMTEAAEDQKRARNDAAAALLQAVAGEPGTDGRYAALYQEVARMFAVGRQRLAEVLGQLDAMTAVEGAATEEHPPGS